MKKTILLITLLSALSCLGQEQISFQSKDSIAIVADLYAPHPTSAPLIILFHQATYSRGEYREIAPKLNAMGFNCLAVDLRSGFSANGVENLTAKNAKKLKKATRYVDTIPDIESAIEYASTLSDEAPILWGSSYSSSLVLKCASYLKVKGVLSFSPGEYFRNDGKPGDYITSSVEQIQCPVFITSRRNEKDNWWGMYQLIEADKEYFLPEGMGKHGSSALWKGSEGNEEYWKAVNSFLGQYL